ncbi:MAG TPA: sugar phosphate isomerase/epimerase [Amycolatopsis sp.]|nr:sugar phosphate isomerase/epimerase [Amycolatopsis sp.]
MEEALEHIAELDFTVIDLSAVPALFNHVDLVTRDPGQVSRIASLVRDFGFEVAGVQSVPWHPDAIDDFDELTHRYTVAADVAQAVGAKAWIVDGNRPEPENGGHARAIDRFKRSISLAAELASARDLRLGIETPHRGTLAETLDQVVELLDASDIPNLGVDLDTSHMLNSGSSSVDIVEAVGQRIVHIALRDSHLDGTFCTPGEGNFDFAEFFKLVKSTGYQGDMTLELEPVDRNSSATERANEAARARQYLEPMIAAL